MSEKERLARQFILNFPSRPEYSFSNKKIVSKECNDKKSKLLTNTNVLQNKNDKLNKKQTNLDSFIWDYLNNAMFEVINSSRGTGRDTYIKGVRIRGKTGSAQNSHGDDHSWFAGYIVSKKLAKMSIVVMIENGGRGSGIASSIAKNIFSYFSSTNKE